MRIFHSHRILVGLLLLAASASAFAQYPKMDAALSDLIDSFDAGLPPFQTGESTEFESIFDDVWLIDDSDRVLVDIYLDGSVSVDQFASNLITMGVSVSGLDASFNHGAISAYIPIERIRSIAALSGLNVMTLTVRPELDAGEVTTQGAKVLRSNVANSLGYRGTGITVGVISDSYDTSPNPGFTAIRAADDINSGDLPNPKFTIDFPATRPNRNTDEGRAMMQIVYDVAPKADLCFATGKGGMASMAANIRRLRTDPACAADVIVDDLLYWAEPIFSDGQIAQAVNEVSTSTALPGKRVAYFSSAGNRQGGVGLKGSINIAAAVFSNAPTNLGNIDLTTVARCPSIPHTGSTKADVAGGWLDFGGGNYILDLGYNAAGSAMVMQWDDRFYGRAVTTDLNFYMFDDAGDCFAALAANNIAQDNGLEYVALRSRGGQSGNYRVMVARTGAGTQKATRIRLVNFGGWSGGPLDVSTNPATYGHNSAVAAISVAAYVYSKPFDANPYAPAFENFSSPGPVTIAFDAAGRRLAVAETRKKPDIAAPDGVDTTFFYPERDPDSTNHPNFFGTSAAAPHAAGVAALLLQKAGGSGSLTPPQIKSILQTTAPPRKLPYANPANPAVKGWNRFDGFGLIEAIEALGKIP